MRCRSSHGTSDHGTGGALVAWWGPNLVLVAELPQTRLGDRWSCSGLGGLELADWCADLQHARPQCAGASDFASGDDRGSCRSRSQLAQSQDRPAEDRIDHLIT
jgi:hypothetical protein